MFVSGVQKVSPEARPVWFVLSGMGTQWPHMGRDLMTLDCFRESIMRSDALLRPHGIELYDLLMNSTEDTFSSTVNSAVGIVAIQVNTHFSYCENKWFVFLFSREFFAVDILRRIFKHVLLSFLVMFRLKSPTVTFVEASLTLRVLFSPFW